MQIVEFFGDDAGEAKQHAEQFASRMQESNIGYAWPVLSDAGSIRDVWETRKLGLGLISNVRGSNKGRDFIEDACVPTEHLADYIAKIRQLCSQHGVTRLSLYAHASVGVVHVVPALDLHEQEAVETMQAIADQAFAWVMEYGGSWSGEHGDGQLRGQYLPAMFGDQIYDAFRQIKTVVRSSRIDEPGKVIDAQTFSDNLRYQQPGYNEAAAKADAAALYRYADQGGFRVSGRTVQRCRCLPKNRQRNDVPLVHGDSR